MIKPSDRVFWSKQSILCSVNEYRDIRVTRETGLPADNLLYQMREDGNERFVFICNTDRTSPITTMIELKNYWDVVEMGTFTGEESYVPSRLHDGWTQFQHRFEGCASLLLRLIPSTNLSDPETLSLIKISEKRPLPESRVVLTGVKLSEPNVLMLDYASFKLDSDETWSEFTEVLRIDNVIRDRLELPRKGAAFRQPWSVPASERASKARVTMRFLIRSKLDINKPTKLALEDAQTMEISMNDTELDPQNVDGWWVDEDIKTLKIPANTITNGTNTLTISFPFGILTNIERLYILGEFSIGAKHGKYQLERPKTMYWGDITKQGFPFYVGNLTYFCYITIPAMGADTTVHLAVPEFSSPVLTVALADTKQKLGYIAFQPRILDITSLGPGKHKVAITAFGNRYNSFGHIHLPDGRTNGCSPDIWRSRLSPFCLTVMD